MSQIGFKARLVAPYFTEAPPEIIGKWVSGYKKAAPDAYQGLKKAIKTSNDFKEKIAKPTQKTMASFIDPKFVSRTGHTHRNIMDKTRDSMDRAGKDYLERAKAGYERAQDEEKVKLWRKEYSLKWCKYLGPLRGYKKGGIKGLSALGVMALCGDPELKNFLKERIDTIEGTPCAVTDPEKPSRFKLILTNRIVHWGSEIINLGYEEQDIKRANQDLNQLVNDYRREEIIPFTSGGASHIDFIVVEITDPTNPNKKKKWLGLEIQVSRGSE